MHGAETHLYGDCAYSSQQALIHSKAPNAKDCTNQGVIPGSAIEGLERTVKRLWGFNKVRYRGLSKNAARAFVVTGLANIYLARRHLMG